MASFNAVFFTIIGLNLCALFFLGLNIYFVKNSIPQTMKLQQLPEEKVALNLKSLFNEEKAKVANDTPSPYKFDNPFIAYYLLEKLDIYEEVSPSSFIGANFSSVNRGFTANYNYCEQHREYIVNHPELIFSGKNYITNLWRNHKIRSQVIKVFGNDIHPEVYFGGKFPKLEMRLDANIFFTADFFYNYRIIGKQFSCLSQASNHIPGHDTVYRKDKVGQALVTYAKKYESKPSCFNFNRYFPKTWILVQKDQCLDFFKEFNSKKYQKLKKERNVVYFRKIGANVHEGKGVFPVTDEEEKYIQNLYGNGTLCGQVKDNNLIQYNIHNLLLVMNRKFGFRMFLLIASTNPLIAFYHDGYARLSLNEYDPNSKDIKTFVTNIGVNLKAAQQEGPFKGMTEAQIQESTCWPLKKFEEYMLEQNLTDDPNWLDNHLRPEVKKVMVHLLRMAQHGFFERSSLFELLGLDFVMDENMQLWFIEANTRPLIDGFTKESTKLMNQMLSDTFEIELALIKSRMKRVIVYINSLTQELTSNSKMFITDLKQKRKKFREISKNKFDPEFELSPENTFQKIIDENYSGTQRYAGLIKEECL